MTGETKLEFPLENELLTTVRLTTGGICSAAGLNIDDGEDCKVCVTESLLLLKHRGYRRAVLRFASENGLFVRVIGLDKTGEEENPVEDEISAALLSALVENVTMEKQDGELCAVSFRFGNEA